MELTRKLTRTLIAAILILALVLTMMPMQADAATKKTYERDYLVGTTMDDYDHRKEINGDYYWVNYETNKLYVSSTKEGKGKYLGNCFGDYILTNGSKVYYVDTSGEDMSAKIYSVSTSGKNRKKIATVKLEDGIYGACLVGIYDNKLYYNLTGNWGEPTKLCYKQLTGSKKTKKAHSDINVIYGYSAGGSRYIYGTQGDDIGTLKVFDCKTNKVVRTIKNIYTGLNWTRVYGSKLYYMKKDPDTGICTMYSASTSGKSAKKVLELPSNSALWDYDKNYLYYYYMTDTSVEYVKYKIKDGSSKILTIEEFQKEDIYHEKG